MNRERARLSPKKNPTENAQQPLEVLGRASSLDDEFYDFFDKGDIGDYEGGVAYSNPPSRPALAPADEPPAIANSPQRKARRAFFARVVGAVVCGCLFLLVSAASFKPHTAAMHSGPSERVTGSEIGAPVADLQFIPPRAEAQAVASPAPAAPEPKETEKPSGARTKAEVAVSAEPANPATTAVLPSDVAEPLVPAKVSVPSKVSEPAKVSAPPHRPLLAARVTSSIPRRTTRAPATVLPEMSHPVVAATPVAPRQSVAAFPVD